jgi:hypothetical protein
VPAAPASGHAAKPVPVRPPIAPGTGAGAVIGAKPHHAMTAAPLTGWTVSLAATSTWLWPTQYSVITATANMNVGPTPYYLRIYDESAGAYVATCASGTTCSVPVTQPTPATHYYIGVVSYYSASYPPTGEQAASNVVGVVWQGVNLSLSASPTTVPVGTAATLTATTSTDIGPSPFWIQIYDATTGTRIGVCGYGTSCAVSVSQSVATTHEYIAYVASYGTAYPPAGIQATSRLNFVTWSNLGWRVSLSAPAGTFTSETVTAFANGNVGPTPYYIEIFNESTGSLLAVCASGTTCSVVFTPSYGGSSLVAFISGYSAAFPPPVVAATSNVITSYRQIIP